MSYGVKKKREMNIESNDKNYDLLCLSMHYKTKNMRKQYDKYQTNADNVRYTIRLTMLKRKLFD